jgi:hypothetical protein
MKASTGFALRMIVLALALVGAATTASITHAAAKCPNRFFKKQQIRGVGDTQPNAQKAYDNDMAAQIAAAKPDCDKLECEDSATEACTFLHTESKKADCKPKPGGFKCTGWMRPGCFCQDPNEEIK